MNYERIYKEFISDRREKEKKFSKDKYLEIHHIKPKCMGGGDEKENLISLTPEDHFFAHLLLAKAFGEKNWLALHSMLSRGMKTEAIPYKEFSNKRKQFGFIRRLASKGFSGRNNPAIDKNVYTFKNLDGKEITGDRISIFEQVGISSRFIGKLINGKLRTYKGWYYPILNPMGLTSFEFNKIEKNDSSIVETLYHIDGREWTGTKYEFYKTFGNQLIFYNEEGSCKGWFKEKKFAENYLNNRIKNKKISRKLFAFEDIKTKEVIYHSKSTLAKLLEVPKSKVDDLILGKTKQLKGKRLALEFLKENKKPNNSYYKFRILKNNEICFCSVNEMSKRYDIPKHRIYQLINGKIKSLKKYGITLA